MVKETEENSGVEDIKVIVIKLPFDLQERLLTFPFLHAIRDKYKAAEIHFITPVKDIEVLNLLPFTAYYHEIDEHEIRTVFDVHRYCVHAKIYNVDLFINLTNSFADASIGLSLRAKHRLGFSDNWKTLVLNQKVKRPVGHHLCEDFFELYKTHVNANIDLKLKVMSRELPAVVPEWDTQPYVAINLTPMRDAVIDEEWAKLIHDFEGQRIIFFSSEDRERVSPLIDGFIARLPKTNTYSFYFQKDWIDLAKMLAYARGVITYEGPLASVAAYVGAKTLVIYDRRDPQKEGPFYFLSDIALLTSKDSTVTLKQASSLLKGRTIFDMHAIQAKATEFFKLT
ncbi:MAG: glycosyltransferase family 9 protein [Bacteriovoracaceae bacterium]